MAEHIEDCALQLDLIWNGQDLIIVLIIKVIHGFLDLLKVIDTAATVSELAAHSLGFLHVLLYLFPLFVDSLLVSLSLHLKA